MYANKAKITPGKYFKELHSNKVIKRLKIYVSLLIEFCFKCSLKKRGKTAYCVTDVISFFLSKLEKSYISYEEKLLNCIFSMREIWREKSMSSPANIELNPAMSYIVFLLAYIVVHTFPNIKTTC